MVSSFYRGGNRGTERLSHLSKVTQLGSERARLESRKSGARGHVFTMLTLPLRK